MLFAVLFLMVFSAFTVVTPSVSAHSCTGFELGRLLGNAYRVDVNGWVFVHIEGGAF